MDKVLALDIAESFVAGVLLDTGGKATVVSRYGVVSSRTRSFDEALTELMNLLDAEFGTSTVSINSGSFTFRNLVLPFQDRQKIEKILPLELEELTARSSYDIHYDFLIASGAGDETLVLAGFLTRERMAEILAGLQSHGLNPECITVSGLPIAESIAAQGDGEKSFFLTDIDENRVTFFLVENGQVVLVRPLAVYADGDPGISFEMPSGEMSVNEPGILGHTIERLNIELKQTLLSFGRPYLWDEQTPCYISGCAGLTPQMFEQLQEKIELPVKAYDATKQPLIKLEPVDGVNWYAGFMNNALALGLRLNSDMPGLNFRRGDFKKLQSLKQVGKTGLIAAVSLAIILLVGSVYAFLDYSRLKDEREHFKTQIRDVFQETLPEVTRVVQPVQQLKVRVDEARKLYSGGSQGGNRLRKVDLLADLSSRIPKELQIRFTRLVADDDDVRLRGETEDFNTVDNLQKELQRSDLFNSVVISSANLAPKGGGVRFELRLEMK